MSSKTDTTVGAVAAASNMVYDKWAGQYDNCMNKTRDLDTVAIRSMMSSGEVVWAGKRVLEFGCGTGRHTEYFMDKHGEEVNSYIAMDVSMGMQQVCRDRIASNSSISTSAKSKLSLLLHDLTLAWPLKDGSVDLMFGDLVLEHIESLQLFFAEASRVLAPGGIICICEFHPFKQYQGKKATFVDGSASDKDQEANSLSPPCFTHDMSDFIMAALNKNMALKLVKEFRDDETVKEKPPRILAAIFKRDE